MQYFSTFNHGSKKTTKDSSVFELPITHTGPNLDPCQSSSFLTAFFIKCKSQADDADK